MFIRANEATEIVARLKESLEEGYTWLAYEPGLFSIDSDKFYTAGKVDPREISIVNYGDDDSLEAREIEPLLAVLTEKMLVTAGDEGIEYYHVNLKNEVSVSYKVNPDGNPLHNPDGNDFTDALIDEMEKGERMILPAVNKGNLLELTDQLGSMGIGDEQYDVIVSHMRMGSQKFELVDTVNFGSDKLFLQIAIERKSNQEYMAEGFRATLYSIPVIVHREVNGIDTRSLEDKMMNVDWFYDLATTLNEWKAANKTFESIKDELRIISHNEEGAAIAVQLWNKYSPTLNDADKPAFLKRLEKILDLYPSSLFAPGATINEAYLGLKSKFLEKELSGYNITDFNNVNEKKEIIEELVDGIEREVKLEKTFIPGNLVERFRIIEHADNRGIPGELPHKLKLLGASNDYEEAISLFEFEKKVLAGDPDRLRKDLMLIGNFKGTKLEFDKDAMPTANTGIVLDRYLPDALTRNMKFYEPIPIDKEVTVQAKFGIQLHWQTKVLEFYDSNENRISLDKAFWSKSTLEMEGKQINSQINLSTMNEQNLEYLKNTLKYMGFEDRVNSELERKISAGEPYFTLNDSKEFGNGNLKTDSVLYFSRGKENEMYFFNKYDVAVTKADGRSENQTMYINRATVFNEETNKDQTKLISFTLKEAANLLDRDENGLGRAVYKQFFNKDNEPYMAWKQIDFTRQDKHGNYEYKPFHENYGFNLEKALEKVPFIEDREKVMQSLQKGNKQAVTVEDNGSQVRRFLAADPENRRLKVFDEKGMEIKQDVKAVNLNYDSQPGQDTGKSKDAKKDDVNVSKANGIGAGEDGPSKKNSRKNGKKNNEDGDDPLLSKKRESQGKGMKM